MNEDGQNGTSEALTVDSAAAVFEGLLSDEDMQPNETKETKPKTDEVSDTDEADDESADESDESDDEVDADAEDADAETDEDADEEDKPPAPKTHRVKIDGEEVEVPEDELLKGYSRTADYTRKTQQLAEERRAFAGEQEAVRAERQKYATALTQLTDAIAQIQPAEPDWDMLRNEHPDQYAATWAAWQQHTQETEALAREREQVLATLAVDEQRALAAQLAEERTKLVEAIPEWKDAVKARAEKAELAEYARSNGFTDDDLAAVTDHRAMVMLRKAMLYDRAQKARQTTKPIVQKRIEDAKVAAPGSAGSTKRHVSDTTKAKQRLAATGRVEDAANVFMTMLPD